MRRGGNGARKGARGEGQRAGCRGMGAGMPGGPRNERPKKECGTWAGCTCKKGGEECEGGGGLPGGGTGARARTGETDGQ